MLSKISYQLLISTDDLAKEPYIAIIIDLMMIMSMINNKIRTTI